MYRADHLFGLYNQYGKALVNGGHSVTAGFLVGTPDPEIESHTQAQKCLFLEATPAQLKGARVSVIVKLLQVCRGAQFDAVICHRYKPLTVMAFASLFLKPVRIFTVVHSIGQFSRFSRRLFAFFFRRRLTYIAVSEAVRQDLLSALWGQPATSVLTLPNIIDLRQNVAEHMERSVAREHLGVSKAAFVVGTIGRLVRVKGHSELLNAFASCKDRMPGAKLVIIGGGALEDSLKKLAADLSISDDVYFPGEIKNARRFLKAYDIFVLPSLREGQGLVLLEAMAAELPIVVSDIPGIAEAEGPWMIRVPPQDPPALGNALVNVYRLGERERVRLGREGFDHLSETLTEERFARRLLSFLVS